MAIFSRFADLSRPEFASLVEEKDSKNTATKTALSTALRCNTQGHVLATHFFESLTREAVHQLQPGIF